MNESDVIVDEEAIEDEMFARDLAETVAGLPVPTEDQIQRYADKMKQLEDIHLEVFGVPDPREWEPDDSLEYKYVEPFQAYRLSGD